MEQFLETENELLSMLTDIRAIYSSKMTEPGFSLALVSLQGTLRDTIAEVRGTHLPLYSQYEMMVLHVYCSITLILLI